MNVAVLLVAVLAVVFVAVLMTGRRIGPLALAAAAGYVFVELWMEAVRVILGGVGINLPWLPDGVVAALILLLAPMGLLMIGGPVYHKKHEKLVAAAVVTLLVAALLVGWCGTDSSAAADFLAPIYYYRWLGGGFGGFIFTTHCQNKVQTWSKEALIYCVLCARMKKFILDGPIAQLVRAPAF